MAFSPNRAGQISRRTGRDVHARVTYEEPVDCAFSVVNARRQREKTSVRADSSGSRGAADQVTTDLGRILIPSTETVTIGDKFAFGQDEYLIASIHNRYDIFGELDHIECDIEVIPR